MLKGLIIASPPALRAASAHRQCRGLEHTAIKAMTEASANLNAAGQVLNLFIDPSIPGTTPFSKIKQKAFSLLEPERFPLVSER